MTETTRPIPLEHRGVDTVMLFFDLVYVFAITGISGVLRAGEPFSFVRAVVLFCVVYWLWCITSIQASMREVSTNRNRLVVLFLSLASLVMAIALPQAFGKNALLFALACWAARAIVVFGFVGASWKVFAPDLLGVVVTGPLLVSGALLGGNAQLALWTGAALVELAMPTLLRGRMRSIRYDVKNVVERFGLLVIVALGETLVNIGEPLLEPSHLDVTRGLALVASFLMIAGLWWSYFHHSDALLVRRLESAAVPFDVVREVFVYGHLLLVGAIIASAAAFHEAVENPDFSLGWEFSCLLGGSSAVFLALFIFVRARTFRRVYVSRVCAAIVVLGLIPLGAVALPAWLSVAAAGLVLWGMALWEIISPDTAGVPSREDFDAA